MRVHHSLLVFTLDGLPPSQLMWKTIFRTKRDSFFETMDDENHPSYTTQVIERHCHRTTDQLIWALHEMGHRQAIEDMLMEQWTEWARTATAPGGKKWASSDSPGMTQVGKEICITEDAKGELNYAIRSSHGGEIDHQYVVRPQIRRQDL